MQIVELIRKFLFGADKASQKTDQPTLYENKPIPEEIHSIWDHIKVIENTQAAHVLSVLGFEEWITMEEILRRIKELFGADYQNKRSLYPYIKTLVDVGLVETSNIGDKKKWRKRDILLKLKPKQEDKEQTPAQKEKIQSPN